MEYVCRWDFANSISMSARVSGRRSIGNSKETVYNEGRSAGVPGNYFDGDSDGLEGSAFLCAWEYFQLSLYGKESMLGKSLLRAYRALLLLVLIRGGLR